MSENVAERVRQARNERPAVERLEAHPYISRVEDVSFCDGRELLEISFYRGVPETFATMDKITIITCWIDIRPGLWGTVIGGRRARKYGFGSDCITALVEVNR